MALYLWILTLSCIVLIGNNPSTVEGLKNAGKQTWGYVEVRPGAFMFYWLYYTSSVADYTKKPLVIWLQGGPGASSTGYGNFEEIGPLDVNLKNRTNSWIDYANVMFIDNPVGSGYSYVNDTKLLCRNNSQIVADLVELTAKFLQKVPEFQVVPVYIFSESYGGKMAAQFALRLQKQITKGKIKCNLKSVSLGDSWISPIDSVLTWAPFLYSTSLIDNAGFNSVNESAYLVKEALDKSDFVGATTLWDKTESVIAGVTNGVSFYNIMETDEPSSSDSSSSSQWLTSIGESPSTVLKRKLTKPSLKMIAAKHLSRYHSDPLSTLMNGQIKQTLGIIPENVTWGGQSSQVFEALAADFMKPVVRVVEALLNNTLINVNVYNGQLDLIVDTMGTSKWVERMNWPGIPLWKKSSRQPIILSNSTEGFVKSCKTFSFYWILKAGHMVPMDNPPAGVEILLQITKLKKKRK